VLERPVGTVRTTPRRRRWRAPVMVGVAAVAATFGWLHVGWALAAVYGLSTALTEFFVLQIWEANVRPRRRGPADES
jgi:hypothetical protein